MRKICCMSIPLLLFMLLSAGCGGGNGGPKVYDDPSRTIDVAVGEEFIISLDSNITTGYSWQLASPLEEDVVVLVGSDYIPEPGAENRAGAGGTEEWTFKAAGKGSTTISLQYVPPGKEKNTSAETTDFNVDVN
jgi:inhibitor of cysteine peptidase